MKYYILVLTALLVGCGSEPVPNEQSVVLNVANGSHELKVGQCLAHSGHSKKVYKIEAITEGFVLIVHKHHRHYISQATAMEYIRVRCF